MPDLDTMEPAIREKVLLASLLWLEQQKKTGQRFPFSVYQILVRTVHVCFVDIAVLDVNKEKSEYKVLLERRPNTGHIYPGMQNIPGGNFLYRESAEAAASRIAQQLGCIQEPIFVGIATYTKTSTEVGVSLLYAVKADTAFNPPLNCQFFDLNNVPQDLVPWQAVLYPAMIREYVKNGSLTRVYEYLGE